MVTLKELVEKVKNGTFNPSDISSNNLQVFLEKHEKLTLIEHILAQPLVDLGLLKNTLWHYLDSIPASKNFTQTHFLAFAKYTRFVCSYIIHYYSLDDINKVKKNAMQYFPFLSKEGFNQAQIAQLLDDMGMPDALQTFFTKTSYRILIGKSTTQYTTLDQIHQHSNAIITKLRTMMAHQLYTTHNNESMNTLNQATAIASQVMQGIPILSSVESATQKLASFAGYNKLTDTGRVQQLQGYIRNLLTLREKIFTRYHRENKKSHIELLSFMYLEGSADLQKNIAAQINHVIEQNTFDTELLCFILQAFAPEPLGDVMYGMHSNQSNILEQLTEASNLSLFKACANLLEHAGRVSITGMANNITMRDPYIPALNFNPSVSEQTRWLAYFLCMGKFSNVKQVKIFYDKVGLRDNMLISYLMNSPKLILSSEKPIYDAILSPLPLRCYFKNTSTQDQTKNILQMANTALRHNAPIIKLDMSASDEEICHLMKNSTIFHEAPLNGRVYFRITTQPELAMNAVQFDISMSRFDIEPGTHTQQSQQASIELLRLLTMAFSTNESHTQTTHFMRPMAVHESVISDKTQFDKIKAHPGRQWLLVYLKNENCSHRDDCHALLKKPFQYDIVICNGQGNVQIEPGWFSKKGHGDITKLKAAFPELEISTAVSNTMQFNASNTNTVTSSTHKSVPNTTRN